MNDPADPLFTSYRSLGVCTAVAALLEVVGSVGGSTILDVGSGDGAFARTLAEMGATVTGLDPLGPALPWTSAGSGSFRLIRSGAECLDVEDTSVDLVTLIFSLHHIPPIILPRVLTEARRVLRKGGRLYAAEPVAAGPVQQVACLFHDETALRQQAATILREQGTALFSGRNNLTYLNRRHYAGFDDYAARMLDSMRFNDFTEAALLSPIVRQRFGDVARPLGGVFDQPVRVEVFEV